jgi:plasmid stabilization system protein ParE
MNHAADEYDEATPGLGDEFLATVQSAFDVILSAPQRWPRVDERHHRHVVRRFPFSIFYRYNETEVVFVAIAHHKRQPGYWTRGR